MSLPWFPIYCTFTQPPLQRILAYGIPLLRAFIHPKIPSHKGVAASEKLRNHEKPRIARLSAGNKVVEPRELITEDHVKFGIIPALKYAKNYKIPSTIS